MIALVVLAVLVAFALGYRFYAKFVGERIFHDQEEIQTPAYEFEDGQDFVPTNKHILFGHHFTSIAGAAPIIGPCIAAYWGVLPALLWVVIGTIFMGAVHDFGSLVVSVREGGKSIADIAGKVVTPRVRLMFLCFVMVLSWLVIAVFAMAIAGLFVKIPSSVLPVNLEIFVALAMGWLLYKKKVGALIPSIVALGILYYLVYLGPSMKVDFTLDPGADGTVIGLGWSEAGARQFWVIALLCYAGVASLLPVWLLLQPRDYINSHQLVVGLGLLFTGVLITNPTIDADWIRLDGEGPPMVPFLFVTIACGAISGFHSLVSSGTTSKQIRSLKDARMIGYGSMLGEGSLALASVLAAVAGIALVGQCEIPGVGQVDGWASYYSKWNSSKDAAWPFVHGGAEFLHGLGLPVSFAITMMAVLVVSFAATTLDTATRIQRFIIAELGTAMKIPPLTNRYVATVCALVPACLLVFATVGPAESPKPVATVLWPIFGASNQMLASLTLMVLSLYFWQRRRPILPLLIPMIVVMLITITALILKTGDFYRQGNNLLVGLNCLMLGMILWMLIEGLSLVFRLKGSRETRS